MEKNKTRRSKAVQWAFLFVLIVWGTISLLILTGDTSPDISLGKSLLIKALALENLLLSLYVGKKLKDAGYFPKELDNDEEI